MWVMKIVSISLSGTPARRKLAIAVGGQSITCLQSIIAKEWYRPYGMKALPVPSI
jgi:hypothetical protein